MLLWQPLHAMMYVGKVGELVLPRTFCFTDIGVREQKHLETTAVGKD
jgi:hypothetical protein